MRFFLIIFVSLSLFNTGHSQFTLNDDALDLGNNQFQLTPNEQWKTGSVWYQIKHNLDDSLAVKGQMYFGSNDDGADGIAFVMQQNCLGSGSSGGGIGYENMSGRSIGIEFDTYENSGGFPNDPAYDHIAIQQNGNIDHLSADQLSGPVQMHNTKTDVEDGIWYDYNIIYTPSNNTIEVYFDNELRISHVIDLKNDVFEGDPYVYWGFTSSTGGNFADNSISISDLSTFAIDDVVLCPQESFSISMAPLFPQNIALNKDVVVSSGPAKDVAVDGNIGSAWPSNPGDNEFIYVDLGELYDIDSVTIDWNPVEYGEDYLIQTAPDAAAVAANMWDTQATITGEDGGFDKIIFSASDVRFVKMQGVKASGGGRYTIFEFRVYSKAEYLWSPDNGTIDDITSETPTFTPTETTTYTVSFKDACAGQINFDFTITISELEALFSALPESGAAPLSVSFDNFSEGSELSYEWIFDNGEESDDESPFTTFNDPGTYTVELIVLDEFGCADTLFLDIIAESGSSSVLIPNVFTPGSDQINNYFKPIANNMAEEHLKIYNRWGNLVFEGNEVGVKWDGTKNGNSLPDGTYYFIYLGKGEDGKIYDSSNEETNICEGSNGCKGHVTLINGN